MNEHVLESIKKDLPHHPMKAQIIQLLLEFFSLLALSNLSMQLSK